MYECPNGFFPECRYNMINNLVYYTVYDRDDLAYLVVESKTPISNCQGKSLPRYFICKQCFYDYQLQKLETVVAF